MLVEARLRVRHARCSSEGTAGLGRVIHLGGDGDHCLAVLQASTPEALGDLREAVEARVDPAGVLDRAGHRLVFRCRCRRVDAARTRPGPVGLATAHGCTVLHPVVYAEGLEHLSVVAPARKRLSGYLEAVRDAGDVTVDRVHDVDAAALPVGLAAGGVAGAFSARQLDALDLAIEHGYYEHPRRAHAEELAAAFGVSRSTYLEHLHKAEAVVMRRFARLLTDHPALRDRASKRRGRPAKPR